MKEAGGEAHLRFVRRGARTVLLESYARAPFYVSPLLVPPAGGTARIALLTSGGGLLGDQHLNLSVHAGAATRVAITTIGATRLLPTDVACRQDIRLHLEDGSTLTYLPEPLIPCRNADYQQQTTIEVPETATAAVGEVVTPGRLAMGERFAYRRLVLALRVLRAGRPVFLERLLLEPASEHLQVALGDHTHLASLVIAGSPADSDLALEAHTLLASRDIIGGAGMPAPGLVVVRALGESAHRLRECIRTMVAWIAP